MTLTKYAPTTTIIVREARKVSCLVNSDADTTAKIAIIADNRVPTLVSSDPRHSSATKLIFANSMSLSNLGSGPVKISHSASRGEAFESLVG